MGGTDEVSTLVDGGYQDFVLKYLVIYGFKKQIAKM